MLQRYAFRLVSMDELWPPSSEIQKRKELLYVKKRNILPCSKMNCCR